MDPPGEAIPDWEIMARLRPGGSARCISTINNPQMANRFLDYDWQERRGRLHPRPVSVQGRRHGDPMEGYAGITYELLRELGNTGIQTPVRLVNGDTGPGRCGMYEDGRFFDASPAGRRFIPAPPPVARLRRECRSRQREALSLLGEQRPRPTMSGRPSIIISFIPFYRDRVPMPYLEMHPDDARRARHRIAADHRRAHERCRSACSAMAYRDRLGEARTTRS